MHKQIHMITLQTNNFWHRQLAFVAIGVAIGIVGLFALTNYGNLRLEMSLYIGAVPVVLAGLTFLAAIATLFWSPKDAEDAPALMTQSLLWITTAILIYSTGGLYSPYLMLWLPAAIFSGIFGLKGLAWAALIPLGYSAWLSFSETFTLSMGLPLILAGGLPVALSYLIFLQRSAGKEDSTYKQLASQFSQVSDKAEAVITAITNGVIAVDKQGVIELINPAAQRLIGWESSDALKLDYKSVLKLEDNESVELTAANDPIRQALSTNQEVRTEDLKLVTNSGKKLDVSVVASPVGQTGSGVIIVFRDITKEKAEGREQTEFISTASHEMRTPVASIEGYLGLALNPATAQIDDKARSYITKAHEVAQHLGRLFQDLLDITKAEDGRLSNNPRAVEVVTFVQDVVDGLRPQADAKGLILIFKPAPDDKEDDKSNRRLNPVFYANVDNDHLREVVSNLVENAIKYTKQGTVSIDVSGDDKQVQISVEDTGIGIPAEDLPHLFQKFYRVDNSDTREIGGTGLGLYLSRRFAEAMESRMWAESQHGQGSTFFVSIPRISHQEAMQLIETLKDEDATSPIGPAIGTPSAVVHSDPAPILPVAPVAPVSLEPLVPTPEPPAPIPTSEGVFVSPSPNDVAAQLSAMTPQPQVTQQQHHAPMPTLEQAPSTPSLAEIEQNPSRYLGRTGTVNVPPRSQDNPPQSQ